MPQQQVGHFGHDLGHGRWSLVYTRPAKVQGRRSIRCRDTGKILTATFHLTDACFTGTGGAFDFHIEAEGEDVTLSFVRVIKRSKQR